MVGPLCFEKWKSALVCFFQNMTNKIKKFLYTLEHLNRDAHEEIQTFAFYRPLLYYVLRILIDNFQ